MTEKLYVIEWYEEGLLDYSRGSGPAEAVTAHYAEQDTYCSPTDEEMREEFSVSVTELPEDLEDEFIAMVEGTDGEERVAAFEAMMEHHGQVRTFNVDVIYTIEGAQATVA